MTSVNAPGLSTVVSTTGEMIYPVGSCVSLTKGERVGGTISEEVISGDGPTDS
jgi:hypothetical protein